MERLVECDILGCTPHHLLMAAFYSHKLIKVMKKVNLFTHIGYSVLAAILYCIPMFFFVKSARFAGAWLLYTGNILFGVAVAIFMLRHIQVKREGASTTSMVVAGHLVTIAGIVVACLASFIVLMIFVPEVLSSGKAHTLLQRAPATTRGGKTNGLVLILFMNAIIGNVVAGSFPSIIFAYTAKLNQTRDEESSFLKE